MQDHTNAGRGRSSGLPTEDNKYEKKESVSEEQLES